jgi:Tol biopolymer transport system component
MERTELIFNPGIKSFDWSNDGTKLVYCTSSEVRPIKIDGSSDTLVLTISSLESVSWRNGGRIAFVTTAGTDKYLSLIYADGSGRLELAAAASVTTPQISALNTNEVIGLNGTTIASVDVSAVTPTLVTIKSSCAGDRLQLSPDASQLTYSKTNESTGVYLLNIATGVETKLK